MAGGFVRFLKRLFGKVLLQSFEFLLSTSVGKDEEQWIGAVVIKQDWARTLPPCTGLWSRVARVVAELVKTFEGKFDDLGSFSRTDFCESSSVCSSMHSKKNKIDR